MQHKVAGGRVEDVARRDALHDLLRWALGGNPCSLALALSALGAEDEHWGWAAGEGVCGVQRTLA